LSRATHYLCKLRRGSWRSSAASQSIGWVEPHLLAVELTLQYRQLMR
jgi:hypothetical protein